MAENKLPDFDNMKFSVTPKMVYGVLYHEIIQDFGKLLDKGWEFVRFGHPTSREKQNSAYAFIGPSTMYGKPQMEPIDTWGPERVVPRFILRKRRLVAGTCRLEQTVREVYGMDGVFIPDGWELAPEPYFRIVQPGEYYMGLSQDVLRMTRYEPIARIVVRPANSNLTSTPC